MDPERREHLGKAIRIDPNDWSRTRTVDLFDVGSSERIATVISVDGYTRWVCREEKATNQTTDFRNLRGQAMGEVDIDLSASSRIDSDVDPRNIPGGRRRG